MIRVPGRDPNGVMAALNEIRTRYGERWDDVFKTITTDNGSEFSLLSPGFPNIHTSIQKSSNNYFYFGQASNGLTPRSRYNCSCFIRTSPWDGVFPGSR